jgi:branched-chain amino acid transport system permease protein
MLGGTLKTADVAYFGAYVMIWGLLALALNLQWGQTGLFNAGIAAFWGVGAYAAAMVVTAPALPGAGIPGHWGIDPRVFPTVAGVSTAFIVAVIVAALAAASLAFVLGLPILRLRADYFAIATLGLSEIVMRVFAKNLQGVTGGVYGFGGVPRPFEFGFDVWKTELSYFALLAVVLVVAFVLLDRMSRSPWGRVLRTVREDEDAAQALGKDTYLLKLQSFVFGAALMGISGAFFAFWLRGVYPPDTQFTVADTFTVWVMVIIGGSGNNRGVLLGTWIFLFLEYVTRRAPDWFHLTGDLAIRIFYFRLMAIGIILILIVLFRPQGLVPEGKGVARRPRWAW